MTAKGKKPDGTTWNGIGEELLWVGYHSGRLPGDVWLKEIRLKVSDTQDVEHMAIVKGELETGLVVAFITAPELDTLVHLVAAKLANGTMKWREDRPYEGR
jgi:hypothetical protein